MKTENRPLAHNHISVDCVVLGFDGKQFKVLLVARDTEEIHGMKLPGSLIYQDEDLDEAAKRALYELTGYKNDNLVQFKSFGSKNRTKNPQDINWLERAISQKVDRIVTVAYFAMVRNMSNKLRSDNQAQWIPLDDVKELAFDHNLIISCALDHIRNYAANNLFVLFDMLPRKFTALQMRTLFSLVFQKNFDVRNFHKKITMMKYVVSLDEYETGVAHRAARYYKFDRKIYNKLKNETKTFK